MRHPIRVLISLALAATTLSACRDELPTAVGRAPMTTPRFTLVQGPLTPRDGGVINSAVLTIANGPLGEYSPRLGEDGNLVCYSDFAISAVRYWSFDTGLGDAVPQSGEQCAVDRNLITSALSIPDGEDIYGSRRAIMLFNVSSSLAMELDPQESSIRGQPAIANNIVAFVDDNAPGSGVRVVNVSGPTIPSQLIFSDDEDVHQSRPNLSPDGDVLVWQRCDVGGACEVVKAVRSSSVWTVEEVVGDEDQETEPDTDGAYIAYVGAFGVDEDADTDILIQAVGGGPVTQLAIPGFQSHPRITRGIISFTSAEFDVDTQTWHSVVHVYVIATNTLYTIGATVGAGMNDLAILTNGEVHMVWDVPGLRAILTADVFATTFTLPGTFAFGGFLAPVNNPPTVNVARAGAAVPVKFSLGGDRGLNVFASGSPTSGAVTCSAGAVTDAVEETVTAGNSTLTYDAASSTYSYIWKTEKAWSNTCRRLTMRFVDGTVANAEFQFTR